MKNHHSLLFIFLTFLLSACSEPEKRLDPFAHIEDEQVKNVLEKTIAQSGGWERYAEADSIIYKKQTILYDSLKNVESDVTQFHAYQLKPYLAMSIRWEKDSAQHEIVYKKGKAKKMVNQSLVEADEAALVRTCMAAYYVLLMPYKLLDPGVDLSYGGLRQLPNGQEVHVVKADYNPDENANHSTNDDWEYYFDKEHYDFVANMVDHGDYFALIYNDQFTSAGGIRFNALRPSFRVKENLQHLWKRGDFRYTAFEVK